jgi:hypothetical protein
MAEGTEAKPELRTRNIGIRLVRVADIEDAEWNFRTHPQAQQDALEGAIDELGWYSYPDTFEPEPGRIKLCDGHLRKKHLLAKYGPDCEIEVNVTDFDEAEARKATLTKDPLAAMAEADAQKLDELLRSVQTGNGALAEMLTQLAEDNGLLAVLDIPEDLPPDTPAAGAAEVITCPHCGHSWDAGA